MINKTRNNQRRQAAEKSNLRRQSVRDRPRRTTSQEDSNNIENVIGILHTIHRRSTVGTEPVCATDSKSKQDEGGHNAIITETRDLQGKVVFGGGSVDVSEEEEIKKVFKSSDKRTYIRERLGAIFNSRVRADSVRTQLSTTSEMRRRRDLALGKEITKNQKKRSVVDWNRMIVQHIRNVHRKIGVLILMLRREKVGSFQTMKMTSNPICFGHVLFL